MNTVLNSFVMELFSNATSLKTSRVKLIAYATMFTAVYFVLSYVVSATIGPLLRGSGAHFFRAFCIKYMRVTIHFTKNEMKLISKYKRIL